MDLDGLDTKQLEAFAAVMSVGSITGAARMLARSQPAVTRQIQELEAGVGFALLHRSGPRIAATAEGVVFHEDVERLLVSLKHIRDRAAAIAARELGPIQIAAIPALAMGLLPKALAKLAPALVPRRIHLRSESAEQVIQALVSGTADFGLASLPLDHPSLDVHWIAEAPCVAVLAADDPLAKQEQVRVTDLAGRCVITMANPYRLRRRVDAMLAEAGVVPSGIVETNASLTAIAAAHAGLGIAIVEPAAAHALRFDGLVIKPLDVALPFLFGAVSAAGRPLSQTIEALSAALQEVGLASLPGFTVHDPARRDAVTDAVYGRDALAISKNAEAEEIV